MTGPPPMLPLQSPPCSHKHFTRIEKMMGDVTVLRCRAHGCRRLWCTNVKELEKCESHFSGGCTDPNCPHTHVFRRKGRRKGKKDMKNGKYDTSGETSSLLSSEEEIVLRTTFQLLDDKEEEEEECDEPPPLCDVSEDQLIYSQ